MQIHQNRSAVRVTETAVRRGISALILISLYVLGVGYNLQCLYIRGAGDDTGWFAWLATNAHHWPMPNPEIIGGNFLSIHMSPIFFVSTLLLAPLPGLPIAVQFSLFISLWAPVLWLALLLLLDRFVSIGYRTRCAIALLLTFNGLTLSMVGFPHVEMLIPALGLLAIALCLRAKTAAGWMGTAIIALLALAVREDAGLHLFLVLLAMAAVSALAQDRHAMWRLLGLAALGLAGSVLALWVQRHGIPDGGRLLGNVYLGHPPLAHLSLSGLIRRLVYWATRREYIFLPILALLISASRRGAGDRRLLLGVAIALPWLALSLVASVQQAGDLWSYYCFPLVFMLFWPLLLGQSGSLPPRRLLFVQVAMGGLSTAAFVAVGVLPNVGDGGSHDRAPWTHLLPPSPASIRRTEAGITNREGWLFDYGAAALAFGSLRAGQFRGGLAFDDTELREARGFLRFNVQPHFVAPQIATLQKIFPLCTPIEGTVLQACTRAP